MAIQSYKCPSCGAPIEFKPDKQKFHCDFCLSEYTEEEINDIYKEETRQEEEVEGSQGEDLGEQGQLASYSCNSCGAEVVTDDTTTSTFCYYCHNPVIISDRLSGGFKPNKMIPFLIDKERAKAITLDWVSKKKFVQKEFYSNSQLEKITGMYLPYWWADCQVDVDYVAEGRILRVWRTGDTEYTETKKYQVVRKGQMEINNVEELAFTKIDHNLLNGIAPYNESEAMDFSMPYLSGFFAEQYNVSEEEITPKIEQQIKNSVKSLVNDSITGYTSTSEKSNNSKILTKEMNYTLLPAWILTYQYEGKTYVFAVNGQTGKSSGELPINKKKLLVASAAVFAGVFALASVVFLIGGIFL